jgi:hypothetical protein
MAIQIQGNSGTIAEVDGTVYRAVRVTTRPTDYGLLGQYRISMQSGTMAAGLAAFATIFYCRWVVAPQLCLIFGVSMDGVAGTTTAFSAGYGFHGLQALRSFTVDGSGGNLATLTGNNQKMRASMPSSLMGTIRWSSTGALATGTSTQDPQGFGHIWYPIGTAASVNYVSQTELYGSISLEDGGNPAPIVLAQNEGISVNAAMPGTGTWQFGLTMAWSEVNSY